MKFQVQSEHEKLAFVLMAGKPKHILSNCHGKVCNIINFVKSKVSYADTVLTNMQYKVCRGGHNL